MDYIQIEKSGALSAHQYGAPPKDVSHLATSLLFEECTLAPNVTLKDVFLLIQSNLDGFQSILGNWCSEITTEALTQTPTSNFNLSYLELYYCLEIDDNQLVGFNHPSFHAIDNEKQACCISFIPTQNLIHLPLKLGHIRNLDGLSHTTPYTLGKILYGIIWELSFYGPPANRDRQFQRLQTAIKE